MDLVDDTGITLVECPACKLTGNGNLASNLAPIPGEA